MSRRIAPVLLWLALAGLANGAVAGEQAALDALVRAYPDYLVGYDASDLL